MAYTYRYLTATERTDIGKRATTPPAPPAADEAMLRAWEADLVANAALRDAATDPAVKARHAENVTALEAALTKAPAPAVR